MDDTRTTTVDADAQGSTLAALVRALMDGLSWSKSRALVTSGRVTVDGELRFDPAERLDAGARVVVDPSGRRRRAPTLAASRLIHVDRDVVVVDKPAGLLSVPYDERDQRDTLIERTRLALLERDAGGGPSKPARLGVVQRLDKDTSGLLVFARTRAGRKGLEAQFRAHTIERRYVALVHGHAEAGVHDNFLIADRGDGRRGSWRGANPPKTAKRAITRVRVEQRLPGPWGEITLVSCQLETGRQHQIRIHLAESGTPLVGERVYARRARGRAHTEAPLADVARPMLHAASLGFRHPVNERSLRFEAPPPEDFRALLDALEH